MIIHLTRDELEWVEIQHHEELSHGESVESVIQAEIFYYKMMILQCVQQLKLLNIVIVNIILKF